MGRRRSDQGTDALRLLAALFVVVIHVADPTTTAGLCWDAAARFSVPVFVIVSGWYLLDRDGGGLARRGARLLGQMVCWSAVYLVYNMWRYGYEPTGLRGVGRYLLTQPPHLWYLWAIAGLYLLTPLLRPLTAGITSTTQQEAIVNSLMDERSDRMVLLADSRKLGIGAGFSYASLDQVNLLITDTGATDEDVQILLEAGIHEIRRV